MKIRTFACFLGLILAVPAAGQQADLAARVAQLEKRVAELEAALKRGAAEAKSDAENKLVGSWTVSEADRNLAVFNDLVLKADGSCAVTIRSFGARPNSTYKVIGKQLIVEAAVSGAVSETWSQCRVLSVSDKELVLEHGEAAAATKVKYNREK